jgi:hypothetical protein
VKPILDKAWVPALNKDIPKHVYHKKSANPSNPKSTSAFPIASFPESYISFSHPNWKRYVPPCVLNIHEIYTSSASTLDQRMLDKARYTFINIFRQLGITWDDITQVLLDEKKPILRDREHYKSIKSCFSNKHAYPVPCSSITSNRDPENADRRRCCPFTLGDIEDAWKPSPLTQCKTFMERSMAPHKLESYHSPVQLGLQLKSLFELHEN